LLKSSQALRGIHTCFISATASLFINGISGKLIFGSLFCFV
jgi:hypothetical protein